MPQLNFTFNVPEDAIDDLYEIYGTEEGLKLFLKGMVKDAIAHHRATKAERAAYIEPDIT
jgi:hypothetical protein